MSETAQNVQSTQGEELDLIILYFPWCCSFQLNEAIEVTHLRTHFDTLGARKHLL